MLDLTEGTRVNDRMYLQTWGIFLYAAQTKEMRENMKWCIQENTRINRYR
jgi:hypothetical protein